MCGETKRWRPEQEAVGSAGVTISTVAALVTKQAVVTEVAAVVGSVEVEKSTVVALVTKQAVVTEVAVDCSGVEKSTAAVTEEAA